MCQQGDIKITNALIKQLRKCPKGALQNKKLENDSLDIFIYSESLFSGNNDGSSQVGVVIFIADEHQNALIIDNYSIK